MKKNVWDNDLNPIYPVYVNISKKLHFSNYQQYCTILSNSFLNSSNLIVVFFPIYCSYFVEKSV